MADDVVKILDRARELLEAGWCKGTLKRQRRIIRPVPREPLVLAEPDCALYAQMPSQTIEVFLGHEYCLLGAIAEASAEVLNCPMHLVCVPPDAHTANDLVGKAAQSMPGYIERATDPKPGQKLHPNYVFYNDAESTTKEDILEVVSRAKSLA